ncbi:MULTISPECIES: ABC transporter permease [Actinomadura]|uniref:FtsX-like permease family protein n=1 Tax=Actinomadura yumaensis TaxID=111807 RepID=A0ABW2CMY0_9ACTN|nr:ABC transporter permease [Actinomadura sp. J1-007]MWK38991.1 FtsX-like permease family protein [Actinomadura sp. J1-007]
MKRAEKRAEKRAAKAAAKAEKRAEKSAVKAGKAGKAGKRSVRGPLGAGKGAYVGAFVALVFATVLVGACGVLVESALRAHAPVERYGAAKAVVTGPQKIERVMKRPGSDPEKQSRPLTEPARLPVSAAERLRAVPGVRAVVPDVSFPVVAGAGRVLDGHGWDSAALRPSRLSAGRAPQAPGEVALDARAGVEAGAVVRLQIGDVPRPYRVTGLVAPGGPPAAYFAPQAAAALSGHPGQADALAVLADGKVDTGALRKAAPAGATVATGDARGDVEDRSVAAARPDLLDVGAAFAAISVLVMLVVVSGLIALSVRERARVFALLRAVGATPGQVRRTVVRETFRIALPAALLGAPLSLAAGALMYGLMRHEGAVPDGFGLALSPLPALAGFAATLLAGTASAFLASLRLTRIRPVEALGEAAAEPAALPRWRTITGAVFLVLGLNALGFSTTATGPAATTSVGGLVIALIVATALLGPLIARFGTRVLGGAARRVSPVAGRLAVHGAAAAALRAGSIITPVALAVAFAGTQLFAQSTVVHTTKAQAADGNRADRVLVSAGPGVPAGAADAARALPGVTAATAVKNTTVVMTVKELGDRNLRSLTARGVSPDAERTMDPKVSSGRLADLRGRAVALSRDVASGLHVGSVKTMWLGDGTRIEPRVVAIYDRGLGFGDLLLPHDLVAAHAASPLDDHVLVRGRADLSPVAARYAGVRAAGPDELGARLSEQLRLQGVVNYVVVAAIAGFVLIGVVTTLALATAARRREFALLRLVGATRRQVMRMLRLEAAIVLGTGIATGVLIAAVTLLALATAVSGLPLPTVPPLMCAALLLVVAASGAAAVLVPARSLLRGAANADGQ